MSNSANFISSKSVEGCSENTIAYYRSTINNALLKINKKISHVTTDDLRNYPKRLCFPFIFQ